MLYQTENQHGGDVYGGGITLDFSANTNPLGTPPVTPLRFARDMA